MCLSAFERLFFVSMIYGPLTPQMARTLDWAAKSWITLVQILLKMKYLFVFLVSTSMLNYVHVIKDTDSYYGMWL